MLIMNQSRDKLINLNNATSIELTTLEDGYTSEICVYLIDDAPETLGEYNTKDRAKEVFEKLAGIQGGASTYYMPEE